MVSCVSVTVTLKSVHVRIVDVLVNRLQKEKTKSYLVNVVKV